jgi:hypothetical protein
MKIRLEQQTDGSDKFLAFYNDEDLGLYKPIEAITKADIYKTHTNKNTSAGGTKMGETNFWDSF